MSTSITVKKLFVAGCVLITAVLLQSCSIGGGIVLHNASGSTIELRVFKNRYELAAGETREVRIDPIFGGDYFSIRTSAGLWCYEMPAVNSRWIKAGGSHAKVLGLLDANGDVYLFPRDSDEASYYKSSPPAQPRNFPLSPIKCRGSE